MERVNCIRQKHTWNSFIADCVIVGCTGYFDALRLTS